MPSSGLASTNAAGRSRAAGAPDLVDRQAEEEEVLGPGGLAKLDVRAVERAHRERAVQRELHVARPRRLLAGLEICSETSAAGMMTCASDTP